MCPDAKRMETAAWEQYQKHALGNHLSELWLQEKQTGIQGERKQATGWPM